MARASSFTRFTDHTQRRATVGRTPLDEGSARPRDFYLTNHNTHNRQTCPPVGFEPTISAGERPQNFALDGAAIGTGCNIIWLKEIILQFWWYLGYNFSEYSNHPWPFTLIWLDMWALERLLWSGSFMLRAFDAERGCDSPCSSSTNVIVSKLLLYLRS